MKDLFHKEISMGRALLLTLVVVIVFFWLPLYAFADVGAWSSESRTETTVYQNGESVRHLSITGAGSNTQFMAVFVSATDSTPDSGSYDAFSGCDVAINNSCNMVFVIPPFNYYRWDGSVTIEEWFEYDVIAETATSTSSDPTIITAGEIAQIIFNGFLLFFLTLSFLVWYFRVKTI